MFCSKGGNARVRKAVVPIAGLGTRFLPVSKAIPKEILPVGPLPVIHWVVAELIAAGIDEIIFVTSPRNRVIERYFSPDSDLAQWLARKNMRHEIEDLDALIDRCVFSFVHQASPDGISNAILCARDFVGNEPFFCHMGDSFFVDGSVCRTMIEQHARMGPQCTLALRSKSIEEIMSSAVVVPCDKIDDNVLLFRKYIEKPSSEEITDSYGVIGRYIFSHTIFELFEKYRGVIKSLGENAYDIAVNALLTEKPGVAVIVEKEKKFYDAGTLERYYQAVRRFLQHQEIL